jgi:hypothetical protein
LGIAGIGRFDYAAPDLSREKFVGPPELGIKRLCAIPGGFIPTAAL